MTRTAQPEAQTGLPPVPVIDDPDAVPPPDEVPASVAPQAQPPRRGRPPKAEGAAPTPRTNGRGRKPRAVETAAVPAQLQATFKIEIETAKGFYSAKESATADSSEELAKAIATGLSEHIAAWKRREQ